MAHDTDERDEVVKISVPASLEYLRLVRLTTSGMASRVGFDVEGVDDLRIAVDELASIIVGIASGGTLDVTFTVVDCELRIEGSAPARPGADATIDELTNRILKAVSDDYGVAVAGSAARFWCNHPLPPVES